MCLFSVNTHKTKPSGDAAQCSVGLCDCERSVGWLTALPVGWLAGTAGQTAHNCVGINSPTLRNTGIKTSGHGVYFLLPSRL